MDGTWRAEMGRRRKDVARALDHILAGETLFADSNWAHELDC